MLYHLTPHQDLFIVISWLIFSAILPVLARTYIPSWHRRQAAIAGCKDFASRPQYDFQEGHGDVCAAFVAILRCIKLHRLTDAEIRTPKEDIIKAFMTSFRRYVLDFARHYRALKLQCSQLHSTPDIADLVGSYDAHMPRMLAHDAQHLARLRRRYALLRKTVQRLRVAGLFIF
jgi:hypothetical protein